jgi:hypothetical protein
MQKYKYKYKYKSTKTVYNDNRRKLGENAEDRYHVHTACH